MKTTATPALQFIGIVVRTATSAGRLSLNHAEGIVVRSDVQAGGVQINHAEGVVLRTPPPTTREVEDDDAIVIEF